MLKAGFDGSMALMDRLESRIISLEGKMGVLEGQAGSFEGQLGRLEDLTVRLEGMVEEAMAKSRAVEEHWQGLVEDLATGDIVLLPDGTRDTLEISHSEQQQLMFFLSLAKMSGSVRTQEISLNI